MSDKFENEEWRDLVGWEGVYQVSNLGGIKRVAPNRGAKIGKIRRPKTRIMLTYNRQIKYACVHDIVAATFLGPLPARKTVNHKNGDITDNRVVNLEYIAAYQENQNDGEEWRDVVGFEDLYQVSNLGRVRRIGVGGNSRPGRVLKHAINRLGYAAVALNRNGVSKTITIHILVAAAFLGPRPPKYDINHKNGRKSDNRPDNLEYVTSSQNRIHAINVLGVRPIYGERIGVSKLSASKVKDIRRMYKSGQYTKVALASLFGVSDVTIGRVVNRKLWTHVD